MRLENYITEQDDNYEKVIKDIKKNCSEIIKEYNKRKNNTFLLRQEIKLRKNYELKTVRKDRKPKDTPPWLHEIFDSSFKKYFDKPLRSQSLFANVEERVTSKYLYFTTSYYIVFPFNGYRLIQSNIINDLFFLYTKDKLFSYALDITGEKKNFENFIYNDLGYKSQILSKSLYYMDLKVSSATNDVIEKFQKIIKTVLDKIVKQTYKELPFSKLISEHEVMIDCNKVYLINDPKIIKGLEYEI